MFDFADAIRSVGEAFASLFNWFKANKEQEANSQMVKDKRRLKNATNVGQELFQITDRYCETFDFVDCRKYKKLRKKFDKLD